MLQDIVRDFLLLSLEEQAEMLDLCPLETLDEVKQIPNEFMTIDDLDDLIAAERGKSPEISDMLMERIRLRIRYMHKLHKSLVLQELQSSAGVIKGIPTPTDEAPAVRKSVDEAKQQDLFDKILNDNDGYELERKSITSRNPSAVCMAFMRTREIA